MSATTRILIGLALACPLVALVARRTVVPRELPPAIPLRAVRAETGSVPTGIGVTGTIRRAVEEIPPASVAVELLEPAPEPQPVPDRGERLVELRRLEREFREADWEHRPLAAFRADTVAVSAILDRAGRSAPWVPTAEPAELPGDLRSFAYRGREYLFRANEFPELEALRTWLAGAREEGPPPVYNDVQRRIDEAAADLSRP